VEDRAEFVGVALVDGVEIMLDDGFDARAVITHG
jgi:hypothetical protein